MKKLLQVFLSSNTFAVSEVSMDEESEDLYCTCPGYRGRGSCKHTIEVLRRIQENRGSYPMEVSNRATKEDAEIAMESEEALRKFVLKFGKIETL